MLGYTSIFLSLKDDLKIFLSMEACGKGGPALKWSVLRAYYLTSNLLVFDTIFAGNKVHFAVKGLYKAKASHRARDDSFNLSSKLGLRLSPNAQPP